MFFVIVLARAPRLYAYVPPCQMKDQSTVVLLENVFFRLLKVLDTTRVEKCLIMKMPQCTRVEDLKFKCVTLILINGLVCKNIIINLIRN